MRSKKALLSFMISTLAQIINTALSIIVRRIFIRTLGADVLGLNSLYSSIVAFLALSELGIGQSIAMCLYKPLAEDNICEIRSYMLFLKKVYIVIGLVIIILGIIIAPFIYLMTDISVRRSFISYSFILYVISTAISYFWSYKKILLTADQKNYVVAGVQVICKLLLNLTQIILLIRTSNYYIFLICLSVFNLIENIVCSKKCDKKYPYIKEQAKFLQKTQKQSLIERIKGLLFYKASNYLIQSTDNIIISLCLGTINVAYYSNYNLISNILYAIFSNIGTSSMAGLGNILYTDKKNLKFAFSKLLIVQHFAFNISTTAFLILSTGFVSLAFGKESELGIITVVMMSLIYDLRGYSYAIESIRSSAGLFSKDRYLNLLSAIINVILSVLLVKPFGIPGILFGTIVSYILKELIFVPNIVFDEILPGEERCYYKKLGQHWFITIVTTTIMIVIHYYFFTKYTIISWAVEAIIIVVFVVVINLIIFRNNKEFRAIYQLLLTMFGEKMKRF
jgi:O-antigen/teichoic acid export membrane protein